MQSTLLRQQNCCGSMHPVVDTTPVCGFKVGSGIGGVIFQQEWKLQFGRDSAS